MKTNKLGELRQLIREEIRRINESLPSHALNTEFQAVEDPKDLKEALMWMFKSGNHKEMAFLLNLLATDYNTLSALYKGVQVINKKYPGGIFK